MTTRCVLARRNSSRVAQAAVTCPDLIELILRHPDPLVRLEAVPRLRARFPQVASAHAALIQALTDSDEAVRCEAISVVTDLAVPGVGELLVPALSDAEPDVRFFAAVGLQTLGDPRAPADPESFAYRVNDA
ncbi:MAG TPA: HEAT repeat domain-containing protein [Chloroflexota bacterium]|jgi:HEAT repeat protein